MAATIKSSVYFDLDGPILDVSERYYRVHRRIVSELGVDNKLTLKRFWALKRRRAPLVEINKELAGSRLIAYRQRWLDLIEQREFLKYDRLQPGALAILREAESFSRPILVTARMKKNNLFWELRRNRLAGIFKKIYVVDPADAIRGKARCLKKDRYFDPGNSIVIGDTEIDIISGNKAGAFTVAVLSGIRDKANIMAAQPDICVGSMAEFFSRYKKRIFR